LNLHVYSQTGRLPDPLRIDPVKDDVYMITGEGGNVAVYVTGVYWRPYFQRFTQPG
jgi:hypothetical protein